MLTKVFCIYDLKGLNYGVPFFMPQVGAAVRMFTEWTKDPQSMISKYPSDFQLYEIGTFDDATAVLKPLLPVVLLGLASDYIEKAPVAPDRFRSEIVKVPVSAEPNGGK